jgi:DNA-binding MarR family transcriptional regulator
VRSGVCVKPALRDMGLMVKRLQMRHHNAANAALAEFGVSVVQWDALRHLHENPGVSLHGLAQLTFQTDQSFGALASRMEARGLIERVPGRGRAIRHQLTAEGERVREAGGEVMEAVFKASFSALTVAQQQTFERLLRKLFAETRATETSAIVRPEPVR